MVSTNDWQIEGDYFESCSCDYLCPCLPTNLAGNPTKGWCVFAMVFGINRGEYDGEKLDGLGFALIGRTPGPMIEGKWQVGLLVDEKATPPQQQAIGAIASGQAGGPTANLGPLIGKFLGVEPRAFRVTSNGHRREISIKGVLEQAIEGVDSPSDPGQPMHIEGTLHPANSRLALAKATSSHVHAFGIDWDEESGKNNGHFAPFSWKGTVPAKQPVAQEVGAR